MPTYFGTTQQTAGWLMDHEPIRRALLDQLCDASAVDVLCRGLFRHGPVRIAFDAKADLLSFWNIDYLTGVGDEGLGFIRLAAPNGLLGMPNIKLEAFERALTVLNYRLRNLIFESAFYHQDFEDGSHKVLAGRGSEARAYSIGYIEEQLTLRGQASSRKIVMCVGPEANWQRAGAAASGERALVPSLSQSLADHITGVTEPSYLITEMALPDLRHAITPPVQQPLLSEVTRRTAPLAVDPSKKYQTAGWTYKQWTSDGTTLSKDQIDILYGDGILQHPMRIIGPAGAGKTLLMQLMAMRLQETSSGPMRILFVTHNAPMEVAIRERFAVLGAEQFGLINNINVTTLERYARETIGLEDINLLEATSADSKKAQASLVMEAFATAAKVKSQIVNSSSILSTINGDLEAFAEFIRSDFSIAIKARNLQDSRSDYVNASVSLGKLHGILEPDERDVVYLAFQLYQEMLEELEALDSDDVALSMIARLGSAAEKRRRKALGFDYIFVDEAQLFNENERRVFQYLSNGKRPYLPIVIALDEGQQFFGESRVGLALLGIRDAERETLKVNHRMSRTIAELAFQIVSQSTDLFNVDFPDYTKDTITLESGDEDKPLVVKVSHNELISNAVAKVVRSCRREGMREIALVCFNINYWPELVERLPEKLKDLDFSVMLQRGERPHGHMFTTLCRPSVVGGQEFDAVVAVGIEQGVVPKKVSNSSLQSSLEQQALRDVYVTFSRARHRLFLVIGHGAELAPMMEIAHERGLIEFED